MASATSPTSEAQARAGVYAFLAEVLGSNPTGTTVRALSRLAEGLAIPFPGGLALDELEREYLDLFIIPGPRYVAPYESVFRDEWELPVALKRGSDPSETGRKIKGLLMGESTLEVREYYLRLGIVPDGELPDHIANEFRLLAHIAEKEAQATNGEAGPLSDMRTRFQRDHLLKWIGELRQRVEQRETLGYYRAALQIAEAILESDEHGCQVEQ